MSDSKTSQDFDNLDHKIVVKPKVRKITPLGYDIELSEAHAQQIAEFVSSPAYGILKKHFVMQRRDQIAREALTRSVTPEQLYYYKGMAAELVLLFKVLKKVKDAYGNSTTEVADRQHKK